jgi:hypothetical protein
MIISHKFRYIFFAIPKTGTHSVRQALRQHMGAQDLEQVGLFVQKKFPFPEFRDIGHGHLSALQIRPVLGEEVFSSYTKFAFVRNPFDRFVSYCAFMGRNSNQFDSDPSGFMRYVIRELRPFDHLLFQPQHSFITDADGKVAMDVLGRNESMQASFDTICGITGMPETRLDRVNATQRRSYHEYYDRDLISRVSDFYRRDLELFDYRFE